MLKRRSVGAHRDFPDFFKFKDESSNHSETGTSGIEEPEPVLECSRKARKKSSVNSTMEAETDVVSTAKMGIVCGLAATSKCPWRQPKKRGSRKVNDMR